MSMALGSKLQLEPGSWLEAMYDVFIGMHVGINHSVYIVVKWWYTHLILPISRLLGFQLEEDKEVKSKDGEKTLKVIGVGYGRTGTYSLNLAFEELGFPSLHTQHLYEHGPILSMWNKEIFAPSIEANTTLMGRPDLQLYVNTGYQATTDLPMALYYEQIMEEFPDCKFVLTVRDSSEVWFRSFDTLLKSITQPTALGGLFFSKVRNYATYLRWLHSVVTKDESYLTVPFPLPPINKEAAIASYEEHNRRVRSLIPQDRLLEYSVKEGWEPLCNFLEIADCPTTPFPKTNSARSVQVQSISALVAPLTVALFIIFFSFAKIFNFITGTTVMNWVDRKYHEVIFNLRSIVLGHEKSCYYGNKRAQKKYS